MSSLDDLLAALWIDHAATTPQAPRLHQLLRERGEAVRIDHIGLRTFELPEVSIDSLERAFVEHGYQAAESYELPREKLIAYHYEHRSQDRPGLLLSALLVDELSPEAQEIVGALVAQIEPGAAAHPIFAASGRPWQLSSAEHERLRAESEYAAWVAAFGFRADHFAVDVGSLRTLDGVAGVNRLLVDSGFRLNRSGGEIKGSAAELLEQSATLADEIDVPLADGTFRIRSGYCELARRHRGPDGALFRGFLPASSALLLESAHGAAAPA
jgi:hypothetical protein